MNASQSTNSNILSNWTIVNNRPSIYDKVLCAERPNMDKLRGYLDKMAQPYTGDWDRGGYTNETDHLKAYLKFKSKTSNDIVLSHSLPKKSKFNRIVPDKYASLAVLRRAVRHTLSEDIYIDIDIVNCLPTILTSIAKKNEYPLPKMTRYVENRTEILQSIQDIHRVDKQTAKDLFISITMGGKYDCWIEKNDENTNNAIPYIYELEAELTAIREIVYTSNPKLKIDAEKQNPTNPESAIKRTVFSKWYFTLERYIQETAISYLLDYKGADLKLIIPCQDGFMILKEVWYENIIEDINTHILESTGIPAIFVVKPFDEVIPNCPEIQDPNIDDWDVQLSDKALADTLYELHPEKFRKYNGILYVYRNNKWYEEADPSKRFVAYKFISEDLYNYFLPLVKKSFEYDERLKKKYTCMLRTVTSNMTHIKTIISHFEGLLPIDSSEVFNKHKHLIGFNNGVYDLLTQTFREYKYSDYITITTGWDYTDFDLEDQTTQQTIEDILTTIQPNIDQRILLLQLLASGLDGHPYQNAIIWQGQGGNGKGLLGNIMSSVLGNYYYKPNASILKEMAKSGSASPDILKMKNKRFIDIEEVGGKINTSLMRNLTGGGSIEARQLYQNTETFKLSSLLTLEINNAFELDGKPQQADYRRYLLIDFKTNFTDDPNKIGKSINGIQYRQANHSYETEEFIKSIRPAFFYMLTVVYGRYYDETQKCLSFTIPDIVRENTNRYLTEQDTVKRLFDYCFVKIEDQTKKIPISRIWEVIKRSDIYVSLPQNDRRLFSRNEVYSYIKELYNIPHNPNNHKPIIVCGIQEIESEHPQYETEEDVF
jgi:hypothetical protein